MEHDLDRKPSTLVQYRSSEWMDHADVTVGIPMHGTVNSLNAAAAAAVVLYEANRQRYT